ncbi:MAG: hypothetical protein RUDDFDWM_000544 [Candidatus Fervidibacterota bacterium]
MIARLRHCACGASFPFEVFFIGISNLSKGANFTCPTTGETEDAIRNLSTPLPKLW